LSVSTPASAFPATFARQWMVNLANSVKGDGVSPPVAARTYAYGAIALYESVVHGMPGYRSLAGQLNGLSSLPQPDGGLDYDWPSVMAATMSRLVVEPGPTGPGNPIPPPPAPGAPVDTPGLYVYPLRLFFEFTTLTQASLKGLAPIQLGLRKTAGVPQNVIDNSVAYGTQLGNAIVAWANSDGYAEIRFKGYVPPKCDSCWVPTGFSDTAKIANPLEPGFGTLRPLVLHTPDECAPAPHVPFSTDPASEFYAQANTVFQTDANLTQDQVDIARFWEDGPGATATPPGHWVAITTKFVRSKTLADAASAYAFVSIGFYDSFISCWQTKYQYNLLRPETYIRRYVAGGSGWKGLLGVPQFSSYTSGHSTQSGASAVLMTEVFGSGPFTDDTKLRRGFNARTYSSFTAASEEAAVSRLYGGIHYPMDNNVGLTQGQCVGNAVASRVHLTL